MKKAVIVSRHAYGPGGGAQAVYWFARALCDLDYSVLLCAHGQVHPYVGGILAQLGVGQRSYYSGCSYGADLLLNIDHFTYEEPLAALNAAHIFHPHGATPSAGGHDNVPPDGYQRLSGNSQYTSWWCREEWGMEVAPLYIPIGKQFFEGRKERRILHVSRFAAPQELADKGHAQLIRAFQWMCDTNSDIRDHWELALAGSLEDQRYLGHLQTLAHSYPITFFPGLLDNDLAALYASSAFYWHATGASMPQIHGAQEHLGLTTLEGMASACVPVVLGTGGQREVVHSEHDGICCADTPTIGRVTLELIDDMGTWSMLSRNARQTARRWQDYNAFVKRVAAWLDDKTYTLLPEIKPVKPQFTPADVCAVIATRDHAEMTAKMFQSILKTEPIIGQIVVIDNGSELPDCLDDLIVPMMRDGDVIMHSTDSLSYAQAMNRALAVSDKPLLLALNNDMMCCDEGWLAQMCISLDDETGVVGAKLIFPDGSLQHAGGCLDFNRPDVGYHRWYGLPDQPCANQREEVLFVTGACLLARRALWNWDDLAGGISYEDADLCLAARMAGWQVIYEPAARLVHFEGATRSVVKGTGVNEEKSISNRDAFINTWYPRISETFPWWRAMLAQGAK